MILGKDPGFCIGQDAYRFFFPLGIVLVWVGLGHWVAHALGFVEHYRSIFHSMVQIQGFMLAFAIGFIFTALPRRTASPQPTGVEMLIGLIMPPAICVAAWYEQWPLSQIFWWIVGATLLRFCALRIFGALSKRRPPNSFVWLPMGFACGLAGSVMTAIAGIIGKEIWWLHEVGRNIVLQGLFLSFVIGLGGLVIPLMTRGERAPDGHQSKRDKIECAFHYVMCLVLVATFFLENLYSLRAGLFLRGLICLCMLLYNAQIWRLPSKPGLHRYLIWLSAWLTPLGLIMAGLFPEYRKGMLHLTFITGFSLFAFAVSIQVVFGHGGRLKDLVRIGRLAMVMAFCLAAAMLMRLLVDLEPANFFFWLGAGSALFLLGTLIWIGLAGPILLRSFSIKPDSEPQTLPLRRRKQ
ncbi:MAG: NnrS family protein [Myxococcota bacterium]|jgi:uncharacterized protein involved in response to NO|nr:NnrS family protein [Myxococcota bacterium]